MGYPPSFIEYFKKLPFTLTSLRKAVLFSLWDTQRPLKAYEILQYLSEIKPNITATTVYRVLEYFMKVGLLHKIESIQAYTLCVSPELHYPSETLMVCDVCHQVTEVYHAQLRELLTQITAEAHFQLSKDVIELKGLCSRCQNN